MAATSVGALLRSERVRRGMDLSEISTATRICVPILEAMENEEFDSLPGGSYRRSFLRQYARVLQLNGDELVSQFYAEFEEPPLPLPVPPKTRPKRHLKEAGCFLLFVAGLFSLYQLGEAERRHRLAVLTNPAAAEQPATSLAAVSPAKPAANAATGEASRAAVAPPAPVASKSLPSAPVAAQTALAADASAGAAQPVRVAFSTSEPVWVSVTCDGNLSFIGTLDGSEAKTFEATAVVTVLFGNAGGVTISLNGQPVGPIGARGEIQLVEFTRSGARRLPRRSSPPIKGAEPQA